MLPSNLISPRLTAIDSRSSSAYSRSGVASPLSLPAVEGLNVAYKRTFIDVSPALSCSVPRSNSMPSLLLDENDVYEPAIYIEDLDLDNNIHTHQPPTTVSTDSNVSPVPQLSVLPPNAEPERTTVMLRNIPNKLTQAEIAECVNNRGYRGIFDFFYAPIDFKSKCNLGYAFINFTSSDNADKFCAQMDGHRLIEPSDPIAISGSSHSSKVCNVSWARIQTLAANVRHYRNNPVNELTDEFRPCLFGLDGRRLGFPAPEKATVVHAPFKSSRTDKQKRQVTQRHKIFVGGLSHTTNSKALYGYFGKFGTVVDAVVMTDRAKGVSKGYGFCAFGTDASVASALAAPCHWIEGVSVVVRHYTSSASS
jgi:RNA recognition motif-containing protein